MIKVRFTNLDKLQRLSNDLKKIKSGINKEANWAVESLYKNATLIYERKIDELVYDKYKPVDYVRTYHLRGGHGAKDEKLQASGSRKSYDFSIDENSVDPNDGTTWREKADKIESGQMAMRGVPFARPFVKETQDALEWENKRMADAFEQSVDKLLDKVLGGK